MSILPPIMVPNSEDIEAVAAVKEKIDANIDMHYTIPQLAHDAAMSESKLKLLFHGQYRKSIYTYLKDKRVEEAKYLLTNTSLPLKNIAKKTGFKFQTNFTTFFTKHTGQPPAQYRKSARQ
jgi:AraC family transcriptional regulator, arabinose operon regulatory protein